VTRDRQAVEPKLEMQDEPVQSPPEHRLADALQDLSELAMGVQIAKAVATHLVAMRHGTPLSEFLPTPRLA
jgi:hypothetical protein